MRFLAIHFPFLPTDRIRRMEMASPHAASREPLAVWDNVDQAQLLTAVDASAVARNLHAGMTLAVARGMWPSLRLVRADPAEDARLLADIADWCQKFTPLAALDPPDSVMLDVSGVAHLFGGVEGLLAETETSLARQGFTPRLSLAPFAAAASAFARFDGPSCVDGGPLFERALRALPIAALKLDMKILTGLRDAGLRRIGDLVLRPRAPITARFGPKLFARIDAMRGLRHDPISPRFAAPPYLAERRYAEGLARREDIARVLHSLLDELCAMLARHDEGARNIRASFFRVDGAVRHLEAATGRPSRDAKSLLRLLDERLDAIGEDGLDTGYGFDVIRVAALAVEPLKAAQTGLRDTQLVALDRPQDFIDLADRLGARLGTQRVLRFSFEETHLPEHAVVLTPAARCRDATAPRVFAPAPLPARPLRLLEKPEPIDAIATVPDGPPSRFFWRRVMHDVAAIEGPERIAAEWWKAAGFTRDYFRVEDSEGGRFLLFREGLFGVERMNPRWFMHGLFG